jgi:hypothetical protein
LHPLAWQPPQVTVSWVHPPPADAVFFACFDLCLFDMAPSCFDTLEI